MRGAGTRSLFVVVALGLTLVLAVVLALLAQNSATYQRSTAEGVLRDYAAFAAEEYASRAQQRMTSVVYPRLNQLTQAGAGRRDGRLPDSVKGSFRYSLSDRKLTRIGVTRDDAPDRWMADTLASHALGVYRTEWYFALLWRSAVSGAGRVLAYTVARDSSGQAVVAYGLWIPVDTLRRQLREVGSRSPLLPPTLTGGTALNSLAAVRVFAGKDWLLFESDSSFPSPFRGHKAFDAAWGGLSVDVTLQPALASRLLIGGLPRSRLPLVLGLLGVTAALIMTAILQFRREQELGRLRSDFVASVSHELRTPLAQIRMFTETLLLGRVRTEQERVRSLEILDQEARRLAHLVDNLLYVARGERSVPRLDPEDIDVGSLVRETVDGFAPLAAARRVTVEAAIADGVRAKVDPGGLRQVLLNLLDNAVKYGGGGTVVTVTVDRASGMARVTVDDQGPGVPPRARERIWDRFARLERDVDTAVAGSGIGLAIVADLVEGHGGRYRVESAPGGGARFVVEFPA
jgi:signal transduction histidine kinase